MSIGQISWCGHYHWDINYGSSLFDIERVERLHAEVDKLGSWVLAVKMPKSFTSFIITDCYNGLQFYSNQHLPNYYFGISLQWDQKSISIPELRSIISLKMFQQLRCANQKSGIAEANQICLLVTGQE